MTKRDVLSLGIRISGMVLLAQAIMTVPVTINSLGFALGSPGVGIGSGRVMAVNMVLSLVLAFAVSWYFLARGDRIAAWLVREDAEIAGPSLAGQEHVLMGLGARIIGLLMVAKAISSLASAMWLATLRWLETGGETGSAFADAVEAFRLGWLSSERTALVGAIVQIVVGLVLLVGATFLADVLYGRREPAPALSEIEN